MILYPTVLISVAELQTTLHLLKAVKMDLKRPIKVLIMSILICFTNVKVFEAARKLNEGKIGTLFRKINQDTVEGSAITISEYTTTMR